MWAPVCASNDVNYPNQCIFEVAQCANPTLTVNANSSSCGDYDTETPTTNCTALFLEKRSDPICGSDGEIYDSVCHFYRNHIYRPTLTIRPMDHCHGIARNYVPVVYWVPGAKPCVFKCGNEKRPVCATDGRNYLNDCWFERENCLDKHVQRAKDKASCEGGELVPLDVTERIGASEDTPICLFGCTKQFIPVCANTGIIFANRCIFEMMKCASNYLPLYTVSFYRCQTTSLTRKNRERGPQRCPSLPDTVCGSDGLSYKNYCFLEMGQTFNLTLELAPLDDCVTTSEALREKVAAAAERSKLKQQRDDDEADEVVEDDDNDDCWRQCGEQGPPYCGSNGIIYPNSCYFDIVKCLFPALRALPLWVCTGAGSSLTGSEVGWHGESAPENEFCEMVALGYEVCRHAPKAPICASDGNVYPNQCHIRVKKCESNKMSKLHLVANVRPSDCGRNSLTKSFRAPYFRKSDVYSHSFEKVPDEVCAKVMPLRCENVDKYRAKSMCGWGDSQAAGPCSWIKQKCHRPAIALKGIRGETCEQFESRHTRRRRSIRGPCLQAYSERCSNRFKVHCGTNGILYTSDCEWKQRACAHAYLGLQEKPGTMCARKPNTRYFFPRQRGLPG
eukprot:GHVU01048681.1.p1 GENE.GHVU01048681.1~~GHVU01048681.1.p1  ORF type:complete len:669 (-),score=53.20 GHVU01048681.1:929-2782(-)